MKNKWADTLTIQSLFEGKISNNERYIKTENGKVILLVKDKLGNYTSSNSASSEKVINDDEDNEENEDNSSLKSNIVNAFNNSNLSYRKKLSVFKRNIKNNNISFKKNFKAVFKKYDIKLNGVKNWTKLSKKRFIETLDKLQRRKGNNENILKALEELVK